MAGKDNLRPPRTKEEARERGRNGGIKSGEARRKKRDAKSAARLILDLPCQEAVARNLKNMNIDEEDFTNRVGLMARLYLEAMTGNVSAARAIIELAGELPSYQLEQKRTNFEIGKKEGGNNAVDDWVAAVIEADEMEKKNGKK